MTPHVTAPHDSHDAKSHRKQLDQRRMEYRRAIERYTENRRLQSELAGYLDHDAARGGKRVA